MIGPTTVVENGREGKIHANGIGIGLGLSAEDSVEDDTGGVIEDVGFFNFDQVVFIENSDLDGFTEVTLRILEILDIKSNHRDGPNTCHDFTHRRDHQLSS